MSVLDGVTETIENQFDDVEGGGFAESGPLETSRSNVELAYRTATGGADYLTAVWNDPRYSTNPDASEESMRESFQLTGVTRDVYDNLFDYQGEWGGESDSVDVVGPPVFGAEGSVLDVLVQREGETHGSRETTTTALVYGALALVVLFVLGPYLGPVLDALLGGDDG